MAESLKTVKSRRSVRRGRLTTLKKQLDEITEQDLRHIDPSNLYSLQKALEKETALHAELQTRYEQLLADKEEGQEGEQPACVAEIDAGAKHLQNYEDYLETINFLVTDYELYEEAERLEKAHTEWADVADPSARTFVDESKEFITKIHDYLQRSKKRASTNIISHGRERLSALIPKTHKIVHVLKDKAETPKADTSASNPVEYKTKLDVELPHFSGNPTEWTQFSNLFSATIKKRGKHLSSEERCCLLLKSLTDGKAKELALLHTSGTDGYENAMEALNNRYGQAHVVLPLHIKTFKTPQTFSFGKTNMMHLGNHHCATYHSVKKMDVDLSTLWAAYASSQFDKQLSEEWSKYTTTFSRLPTMEDLESYVHTLVCRLPEDSDHANTSPRYKSNDRHRTNTTTKPGGKPRPTKCTLCNEASHPLARCQVFKDYSPEKRGKVVREWRWCTNCLHHSHNSQNCPSTFTCRHCGGKHHTLLHRGDTSSSSTSSTTPTMVSTFNKKSSNPQSSPCQEIKPPAHGFLHTAMVKAVNGGRNRNSRLVLDSGSSTSLITEALASQLRLQRYPQRVSLEGAYSGGSSKHYVQVSLHSLHNHSESINLRLSVVSKLPHATPPTRVFDIISDSNVRDLQLADSQLGGRLDILLGCLDFSKCLKGNLVTFPNSFIMVQPTIFGWTVAGPLDPGQGSKFLSIQACRDNLDESLQKLWELEQVPTTSTNSPAEVSALQQFENDHRVVNSGRYEVTLPRVTSPPQLGLSKPMALSRFHQNEKSLSKKDKLKDFNDSLLEYKTLDHAEIVPLTELSKPSYYLPVHGVFKSQSTTTKVRPVFDASAKSNNGTALNDQLLAGPNLYPLLTDILIQFRSHAIGFSADISKMFREILLNADERDFHRFLMRDSDGSIKDYRMKRLTFGVKSSPFLATKVLHDLAEKHSVTHPTASKAILNHFYVDDFLSGAQTLREAVNIREELSELLSTAGMTLRKWRTSNKEFADSIPVHLRETDVLTVSDAPKALGIHWDVRTDSFHISTPVIPSSHKITKRLIASLAAQVYDILGLYSPFIIRSKLLLQQLWKDGLGWDDEAPQHIQDSWNDWVKELPLIHSHSISRRYHSYATTPTHKSLHGFADASTLAYGAVIYLRLQFPDGSITSSLVISKARVAPVKPITIPRAELTAAHLLAKLLLYTAKLLNISLSHVHAWTDSTIVLCWLRKLPSTLQTFVANRIGFIQSNLHDVPWRHVPSQDNPADLLSRGVSSSTLTDGLVWWVGPKWLSQTPDQWTPQEHLARALPKSLPETKAVTLTMISSTTTSADLTRWSHYSSYHKLTRILAWVQRFISNCRSASKDRIFSHQLSTTEVKSSKIFLLVKSQNKSFPDIYSTIRKKQSLPKTHPLSRLNLHIDEDGIIRISGRVRQDSCRKPKEVIALSLKSSLTRLLVSTMHHHHLHPGVSALLAILTEDFYISGLKNFLKKISRSCATCQKAYARTTQPQIGLLPSERTTPTAPFHTTGLDFAGPVTIRQGHTRKPVLLKAYVCVFVCFSTKAIHLELCADLTTDSFMAALRRFCSRRGTPAHIHSDNGTNFAGAAAELRQTQHLVYSSKDHISNFCNAADIEWHFIPPRAPNFGGLWEAGVKQMKTLLRKQISPHPLRFEELTTILADIEAILNSRPIVPLDSTEISEDLVLTPGHFLVGRPLKSPARPCPSQAKIESLKRWHLVQRLQQDLWLAWQGWYLQTLMRRAKDYRTPIMHQIGDIVLLKDESLSTSTNSWPMAKIVCLYKGDDGIARAADILFRGKIYRRSTGRFMSIFSKSHQE